MRIRGGGAHHRTAHSRRRNHHAKHEDPAAAHAASSTTRRQHWRRRAATTSPGALREDGRTAGQTACAAQQTSSRQRSGLPAERTALVSDRRCMESLPAPWKRSTGSKRLPTSRHAHAADEEDPRSRRDQRWSCRSGPAELPGGTRRDSIKSRQAHRGRYDTPRTAKKCRHHCPHPASHHRSVCRCCKRNRLW